MKISVLLPYKENFSENYAGAVSIFVRDTIQNSQFFKTSYVFGNMKKNNGIETITEFIINYGGL